MSARARSRSAVGELGELGGRRVRREFGNGREKKEKRSKQCLAWFDRGKLKIFELILKSFEYQSCSSCQNLQFWFQTFSHLRLGLKVKNSNSSLNEKPPKPTIFRVFLQISCCNLKNFEYESCLSCKTLQLLFWAKVHLS